MTHRPRITVPGHGTVALPEIAGHSGVADPDLRRATRDFGNHVHHRPLAVAHPAGAGDVVAVVRFAHAHGLAVAPRGAGHSVDGQAQARAGIVIDMSDLACVSVIGPDRVVAGAGARWSAVVAATLAGGTVPPVLTDYLGLSVGGTLAVGGIGGASQRYGSQADNVVDLDVVTPDGTLVTCSAARDGALFDAVRGGQGRFGIVTRATLELVPAPETVRRRTLVYHDLGTYLTDQRLLVEDGRFDHLDGQARLVPGAGWTYVMDAVSAAGAAHPPDDATLLRDVGRDRSSSTATTLPYREFLNRFVPVEAHLRAAGAWHLPHPRCTVLVPGRHAAAVVGGVLAGLTPDLLGPGGSVLLYTIPTARIAAPNVPRAADALTVVLGVQRTAPAGDRTMLDRMRSANTTLRRTVEELGGAAYAGPLTHPATA